MFTKPNFGGNVIPKQSVTIRRSMAIGDAIASTIVADKLLDAGIDVRFQTIGMIVPVISRHPRIQNVTMLNGSADVDLDGAYEKHPQKRQRHFYGLFMESARRQLALKGVALGPSINCRPRLRPHPPARAALREVLEKYPHPWVFICPRSNSYKVRQISDGTWGEAAREILGTKFWIGTFPAPEGIVDLKCANLNLLIDYLSLADLLITVDTGPMHIANALGVQVLAIEQSSSPELHLGDQTDFRTIRPALDCLNCMENVCPKNQWIPDCQAISPRYLAQEANRSLLTSQSGNVSAVIPIFKPRAEMLNRCLQAVLPQVQEVIITRERGGIVPAGVLSHQKIRYVVKPADNIGFGRNVNFGVRHSSGKFVLVLNDDVYLDERAVMQMMACMQDDVGVVGQLLRYPNGKIYHAGKLRDSAGGIGFPHVDLGKAEPTITGPMEMENTNGASILFRRQAFYDADGYDEGFQFYAEDDDVCMKVRKAGWRLWYTPLATGIHDEHQETKHIPGIWDIMHQSNARFGSKWAEYFRHNRGNRLGNFDYLKR